MVVIDWRRCYAAVKCCLVRGACRRTRSSFLVRALVLWPRYSTTVMMTLRMRNSGCLLIRRGNMKLSKRKTLAEHARAQRRSMSRCLYHADPGPSLCRTGFFRQPPTPWWRRVFEWLSPSLCHHRLASTASSILPPPALLRNTS